MRPFLVTEQQAGKLPRWALVLLCVLYAIPGFVGRDPWRHDDAAGFGIALTMARGSSADWLMPNIAGEPVFDEGPLPFWVGAAAIRLMPFVSEHTAARLAAVVGVLLSFIALWYATYTLVKRPGVLPADPFGAAASRIDFGRAIADCALLVLLATLGVIARLHETSAEAAQLATAALFLYGSAISLERPRWGGVFAGAAIAATAITRGLLPAGVLLASALVVVALSRPYRLIAPRWLASLLPIALAGAALWPATLWFAGTAGRAHLDAWLAANLSLLSGADLHDLAYFLRTVPWYYWPAWPIAGWALVRWRGRVGEPAVALPLSLLGCTVAAAIATADSPDVLMPIAALPTAMLAAVGLPTFRRTMVSLIDWFAVMTYSVIGLAVWAYWIALVTGWPPRMAFSAKRIAPGFEPSWTALYLALGLLATAAWVLLVRWRVSRQPPMIWRAVVLSAGGLVFAWFLLMTLWLPAFDQRNTYREVSQQMAAALPPGYGCVATRELGRAQRASLYYFGHLRFGRDDAGCQWLLVQDTGPIARTSASPPPGWQLHWEGSRVRDRNERLRLYRRTGG